MILFYLQVCGTFESKFTTHMSQSSRFVCGRFVCEYRDDMGISTDSVIADRLVITRSYNCSGKNGIAKKPFWLNSFWKPLTAFLNHLIGKFGLKPLQFLSFFGVWANQRPLFRNLGLWLARKLDQSQRPLHKQCVFVPCFKTSCSPLSLQVWRYR